MKDRSMDTEFQKAVKEVTESILSMSKEEFEQALADHCDGDIAQMLLETGALNGL
jgi:hypothetical protein